MKHILFILLSVLVVSCTGIKSTSGGVDNASYIELLGDANKYKDGVTVQIDNDQEFSAQVNKPNADRPKGTIYKLTSGKHTLVVKHAGVIVYQKVIFTGSGETKTIQLP